MKRILLIIIIILLSFSLSGCSQKEVIEKPSINLINFNINNKQITILNNEVIKIDDLLTLDFCLSSVWSYKIESFMTAPNLPRIELKKTRIKYSIFLDGKIIEDNSNKINKEEYEVQKFSTNTGFLKTTAILSSYFSNYFKLPGKGTYLIKVELNIKVDGIIKNYINELKFELV